MSIVNPSSEALPEPTRGLHISDQVWLATLYGGLERHPDWWFEFRFLEDRADHSKRAPVAIRFMQNPEEIRTMLETHRRLAEERAQKLLAGQIDIPYPAALFYGVQPRITKRGRKEHVAAMVALTADIDCKDWEELAETERPRAIWRHLHAQAPTPSVVIWTGHGIHSYWLLREPLMDKRRGEAIQKAMARALRGDHVQDCSRLLRWPHTVNYKRLLEGAAKHVLPVWWQPETRYDWKDLEVHFSAFADARTAAVERDEQSTRRVWKRFHACLDADSDLKTLWTGGPTGLANHDRSALDMALAHAMVRHQFAAAAFDMVAPLAPWNEKKPLELPYLRRTWNKAQAFNMPPGEPGPNRAPQPFPSPTPAPHPPVPVAEPTSNPLSGLLLSELPDRAWRDWACLYRNAVAKSTEAADAFHYLALLTVVGAVLGRSVSVFCGGWVYCNIYAMLIGPTGDRKSTAADLALALLPEVAPEVLILNGVGSQEGLMERMAGVEVAPNTQRRTLLAVDEVASLLKKSRRESSGSLLEFITEVFHCPDFKTHTTRAKGIHLERPTLSILAASTPAWLEAALEQEDILGGFANRFVYVTAPPKADCPLPAPPDEAALVTLRAWIRRVAHRPPLQLRWTPAAATLWSEFYLEWRRALGRVEEHVAALLRRIDIYILKFACITAAMEDASDIAPDHLNAALDLGRFLAGCTVQLLGDLGAPRDCRLERLVEQKLLSAQGQLRRKQLRQSLGGRITGEKLDRILSAMERNGVIRQLDDASVRGAKIVQLT